MNKYIQKKRETTTTTKGVIEMAQLEMELVAHQDNLSWILRTQMVKRENQLLEVVL